MAANRISARMGFLAFVCIDGCPAERATRIERQAIAIRSREERAGCLKMRSSDRPGQDAGQRRLEVLAEIGQRPRIASEPCRLQRAYGNPAFARPSTMR
jgi:hypothetical protein